MNTLNKLISLALTTLFLVAGCDSSDGTIDIKIVDPLEYLERPLTEQVAAVEDGTLSCQGLVQGYVDRIVSSEEDEEGINAFISVVDNPAGLAADVDTSRGGGLLLQCGVIAIKDNIDMAGLPTTAGSLAMENNLTDQDATLVEKLREHGAVLIGKANLSEWAFFRAVVNATSGWSSLGGQTKNGANSNYNPCGSSSGSAAAVAAGLVAAAIGTETYGSITCPAAMNGIVGMKPTVGLVSRSDVIPISHVQDTAGPLTRTVKDAARILSVLAGQDQSDPATENIPANLDLDFEAQIAGADLLGVRLGLVTSLTGFNTELDDVFSAEIERLVDAGAVIVPVTLPNPSTFFSDMAIAFFSEFKAGISNYLTSHARPGQVTSLTELILFNQENAEVVMPYFGQELFLFSETALPLDAPEYIDARERVSRLAGEEGIWAVMMEHNLDALVAPTGGTAWLTNYETGDTPNAPYAYPWAAAAGYPHITVPMGQVNNLPVGLSIFAGPWEDAKVLSIAYAYEQLPR
jgi:amidase